MVSPSESSPQGHGLWLPCEWRGGCAFAVRWSMLVLSLLQHLQPVSFFESLLQFSRIGGRHLFIDSLACAAITPPIINKQTRPRESATGRTWSRWDSGVVSWHYGNQGSLGLWWNLVLHPRSRNHVFLSLHPPRPSLSPAIISNPRSSKRQ